MGVGRQANHFSPETKKKKQKITETAISQELISNGEAVTVDGGTTGHTMTSMGESLREAHRPTRSLATPKARMRVGWCRQEGWTSWAEARTAAKGRAGWKTKVAALCALWRGEN